MKNLRALEEKKLMVTSDSLKIFRTKNPLVLVTGGKAS